MKTLLLLVALALSASSFSAQAAPVTFDARSAKSGAWSAPATWADGRAPKAGDRVQVRAGHTVVYDAAATDAIRMIHVAGTLAFSREKSTRLEVGLIKIEPGEATTEDGFDCHADAPSVTQAGVLPVLEIGSAERPIPAGVTALIRLVHFEGMNPETLPAILNCGGRWETHGAPMNRTWLKLGASVKAGESVVKLTESVTGWRVGDTVIVTVSKESYGSGNTFRQSAKSPRKVQTEERRNSA